MGRLTWRRELQVYDYFIFSSEERTRQGFRVLAGIIAAFLLLVGLTDGIVRKRLSTHGGSLALGNLLSIRRYRSGYRRLHWSVVWCPWLTPSGSSPPTKP